MDYLKVNNALNEVFFKGRFAHQPIYIDLEDGALVDVARLLDVEDDDVKSLVGGVTAKTLTLDRSNVYEGQVEKLKTWVRSGRKNPPPFTTLLCALSIAAERMRQDEQFSANNYYERLFEVLGVDDDTHKNKLKQSAKYTQQFWRALTQWLAENHNEFGQPTARQVNSWKYVSYALSQALVRDADRKKIHNLFVQFGLSPFEELNEAEMMLFLDEWMTGSGPSNWLKKLWSVPDLRERVCTAATLELQSWDGSEAQTSEEGVLRKRFTWAAALSSFPRKRLELFLTTIDTLSDNSESLVLPKDAPAAAKRAFESCTRNTWLSSAAGADFKILEPTADIELSALMLASFELQEANSGRRFSHSARAVVPLIKLDTGAYYREVSRTSLVRRHIVLCHKSWQPQVRQHLDKYARTGFRETDASTLEGLPPDWVLFEDVEILGIADHVADNLQALVPLSEGVTLQLIDGMSLGAGAWHIKEPPTAIAASEDSGLKIELREETFGTETAVLQAKSSDGSTCVMSLDSADIGEARHLYVVAIQGRKDKSEKHLSLRSAETPRLIQAGQVEYQLRDDCPGSWLSAIVRDERNEALNWLSGMVAGGPDVDGSEPILDIATTAINVEQDYSGEEFMHEFRLNEIEGLEETCVIRGYHYWICQTPDPNGPRRQALWMRCKDCRQSVLTKNRGKRRNTRPASRRRARQPASKGGGAPRIEPEAASRPGPELLLDALCYFGSGSWQNFQAMASLGSGTPWFASEFARALHDLGHVDLAMDNSFSRVERWSVTPPALVMSGEQGYLAGFRCDSLIEVVSEALEAAGASLSRSPQEGAPDVYRWTGINEQMASDALEAIADPHGRAVLVVQNPARFIANCATSLAKVLEFLPEVQFDAPPDLARFNPRNGRWTSSSTSREPGAYRTSFAGRRYFIRLADGGCREGSYEIVKVLAAARAGLRLHGYDPATRIFESVPGCSPPGLLRRALVACSGTLPSLDSDRLSFKEVDPVVGALVMSNLYGE